MLNKPRLLTPGPTLTPERIRLAMAQDMMHHRKSTFKKILGETQKKLQRLFETTQLVLPLAASGSGAMTAAVTALFSTNEKVIVINGGKFAERWVEIATLNNLDVMCINVEWGQSIDLEVLRSTLLSNPDVTGVFIQQSETSTGVQHPIKEVAALVNTTKALLIVDGVSGVSISPCPMDAWGIDCLLTGSQKGLMLPPGLSFIALSEKAWEKAEKVKSTDYYFNLLAERKNASKNQTHFTSSVSFIIGLHEALTMFEEVGYQTIYQKQWALTQMVRSGVKAMGLTLFAPNHYAWGVTSILLPEAISATQMVNIAEEKYNVIFAAGQDTLKERIIRFGHMGWVDFGDVLVGLHALSSTYIEAGGFITCRDYLEQALNTYTQALHEPIMLR